MNTNKPAAAPTPVEPPTFTVQGQVMSPTELIAYPAAPAESQGVERAQPVEQFVERMLDEFAEAIENADPEELKAEMEQDMGKWEVQRIAAQTKKTMLDAVDKFKAAPVEGVERVTDDRPAETIPERYAKDFKDASGWHNGSYIQQLHRELGNAETRIEVLEAALDIATKSGELSKYISGKVRAALAAPSGVKVT